MDAEEAQAQLEMMLQSSSEPTLSGVEVTALIELCKIVDSNGLAPSDASWTPTWNLNIGAAEGWRWKSGKVAGKHDYKTVGLELSRSQMHQMCLEQAKRYGRRCAGTIPVPGQLARVDD